VKMLLRHFVGLFFLYFRLSRILCAIGIQNSSVVELDPKGAKTFCRSWSRYIEVSAPAPGSGSAKVVYKNHNSYSIGSSK
jgi:hypothetical protein